MYEKRIFESIYQITKHWIRIDIICEIVFVATHTQQQSIFFNLIFGFDCFSHRNPRTSKGMKDENSCRKHVEIEVQKDEIYTLVVLQQNVYCLEIHFVREKKSCFVCYLYVSGLIYVYACEFIFFFS